MKTFWVLILSHLSASILCTAQDLSHCRWSNPISAYEHFMYPIQHVIFEVTPHSLGYLSQHVQPEPCEVTPGSSTCTITTLSSSNLCSLTSNVIIIPVLLQIHHRFPLLKYSHTVLSHPSYSNPEASHCSSPSSTLYSWSTCMLFTPDIIYSWSSPMIFIYNIMIPSTDSQDPSLLPSSSWITP